MRRRVRRISIMGKARRCEGAQDTQFSRLLLSIHSVKYHCVKNVQIQSFFWSLFSRIRTKYRDLFRRSPHAVRIRENTDQKKNVYLDTFHSVLQFHLVSRCTNFVTTVSFPRISTKYAHQKSRSKFCILGSFSTEY